MGREGLCGICLLENQGMGSQFSCGNEVKRIAVLGIVLLPSLRKGWAGTNENQHCFGAMDHGGEQRRGLSPIVLAKVTGRRKTLGLR